MHCFHWSEDYGGGVLQPWPPIDAKVYSDGWRSRSGNVGARCRRSFTYFWSYSWPSSVYSATASGDSLIFLSMNSIANRTHKNDFNDDWAVTNDQGHAISKQLFVAEKAIESDSKTIEGKLVFWNVIQNLDIPIHKTHLSILYNKDDAVSSRYTYLIMNCVQWRNDAGCACWVKANLRTLGIHPISG